MMITAIQLELLNDQTTQEFVKSFSNKSQPEGAGLKRHALRMEGNLLLLQDGFEAVIIKDESMHIAYSITASDGS